MPSFKTHSIHGELVLPGIDKKTEISKEDIKSFCIGPDAMAITDSKTFNYQHANRTRRFFCTLINLIKRKKLLENSEVMAFLYSQIDHFVLDSTMHPLIYYMTENIKPRHVLKPHALIENWIDDYTCLKYKRKQLGYYRKWLIQNKKLISLINEVYHKVYGVEGEGNKFSLGMLSAIMFDSLAKTNAIGIAPLVIRLANLGDFTYRKNYKRALPYLNLDHQLWYNPETMEESHESFDDLWKKSIEDSQETINDVNKFLYQDKELTNKLILNDTSWDTGLPCKRGQTLKYVKKY